MISGLQNTVYQTFEMLHLFFVPYFVPPKSYFVFLSSAVFCKMVDHILQRGPPKSVANIFFNQQSMNGIPPC